MRNGITIENIEEMRRREGIDDVELREAIRALVVGDLVKLTLLTPTRALGGETVLVRITSIQGYAFRGRLASRPATAGLAKLRVGARFSFNADHIHSLPRADRALPARRARGSRPEKLASWHAATPRHAKG